LEAALLMTAWPLPFPNVATLGAQVKSHARNFGISGTRVAGELASAAAIPVAFQNAAVPSKLAPTNSSAVIFRIYFPDAYLCHIYIAEKVAKIVNEFGYNGVDS